MAVDRDLPWLHGDEPGAARAGRTRIRGRGIEIMSADDVAAVVVRSIDERANGAQWVIWPGQEPHRYEWALPVDFPEVVTRP